MVAERVGTNPSLLHETGKGPEKTDGAAQNVAKYERLVLGIENQMRELNDSKKTDTGIVAGVGDWIGEKTGAYSTGKEAYSGAMSNLAATVKELHAKIRAEFPDAANLSETEKTRIAEVLARLQKASVAKLEGVSWADAVTNSAGGNDSKAVRDFMKFSGIRTGLSLAEGGYDFVAFLAEIPVHVLKAFNTGISAIHDETVRNKILDDTNKVLSAVSDKETYAKILEAVSVGLEKFGKLPFDKQIEGVAYFVGGCLVPIGIGAKVVQTGKTGIEAGIATAKAGGETAARAARIVAKQAERASGVSERALKVAGKAATAGVAAMSIGTAEVAVAGTAVAAGTTVRYVGEMGAGGQKKAIAGVAETAAKDSALADKMAKAEVRSGVSPETVLKNAALPDGERLALAEGLLGRGKLTEAQKTAILHLHNDVSNGVYQNGHKELRAMVEELDKAGFSRKEGRRLMENGVLGFEDGGLKMRGPEYFHGPERIIERGRRTLTKEEALKEYWEWYSHNLSKIGEPRSGKIDHYDQFIADFKRNRGATLELPEISTQDRWNFMKSALGKSEIELGGILGESKPLLRAMFVHEHPQYKGMPDLELDRLIEGRNAKIGKYNGLSPDLADSLRAADLNMDRLVERVKRMGNPGIEKPHAKLHLKLGKLQLSEFRSGERIIKGHATFDGAYYVGSDGIKVPHGKGNIKYGTTEESGNFIHGELVSGKRKIGNRVSEGEFDPKMGGLLKEGKVRFEGGWIQIEDFLMVRRNHNNIIEYGTFGPVSSEYVSQKLINGNRYYLEKPNGHIPVQVKNGIEKVSESNFWEGRMQKMEESVYSFPTRLNAIEESLGGLRTFMRMNSDVHSSGPLSRFIDEIGELAKFTRKEIEPNADFISMYLSRLKRADWEIDGLVSHLANTEVGNRKTAMNLLEERWEVHSLLRFREDLEDAIKVFERNLKDFDLQNQT